MDGRRERVRVLGVLALAAVAGLTAGLWGSAPAARPTTLRIGLIGSLFRDIPQAMVLTMAQPFRTLLEAQTGLQGSLVTAGDADDLGQRLSTDKVDLAVFHGIEFGWARKKFPALRPLVIAINSTRYLRAHLIVCKDSPVAGFADLKGKTVALPYRSREHCRLFLERQCGECGQAASQFLGRVTTPSSADAAIEAVLTGKAQATVIDDLALASYKERKAMRAKLFKAAASSQTFPAAVVAYRQGALDDATLERFRTGMVSASREERGRHLLMMFNLTGFERIPADYEQTLEKIVRTYPPAAAEASKTDTKAANPPTH
jgi:ABC-type phosphate/phosphonate transport system substrate-binding protein